MPTKLKDLIKERRAKTGETYAVAKRNVRAKLQVEQEAADNHETDLTEALLTGYAPPEKRERCVGEKPVTALMVHETLTRPSPFQEMMFKPSHLLEMMFKPSHLQEMMMKPSPLQEMMMKPSHLLEMMMKPSPALSIFNAVKPSPFTSVLPALKPPKPSAVDRLTNSIERMTGSVDRLTKLLEAQQRPSSAVDMIQRVLGKRR